MYLEHFHFREHPFSLTPDPDFFFAQTDHLDALNVLRVAVRSRQSFIKITGESGLGKTLLCRTLLRNLDRDFLAKYIPNPRFVDWSAVTRDLADAQVMRRIQLRLTRLAKRGERLLLIFDEAHQLPEEALEAVRLLSNLETEKLKPLQIVLVGQPELDRRLAQPSMRQFKQLVYACHLKPLNRAATARYIAHRLKMAGCDDGLFTPAAMRMVCAASRGVPRLINVLCHKALMVAFGRGETTITKAHVRRAAADTEFVRRPWFPPTRRLLAARLTGLSAAAATLSALNVLPWIHR